MNLSRSNPGGSLTRLSDKIEGYPRIYMCSYDQSVYLLFIHKIWYIRHSSTSEFYTQYIQGAPVNGGINIFGSRRDGSLSN